MLWFSDSPVKKLEQQVKAAAESIARSFVNVEESLKKFHAITDFQKESLKLREEIETLKIEKGRKEEEFARKEREIEHKVGLERKRQEFELTSGKKEAELNVREENLKADRKRFEDQMRFHEKRFTEEVTYLKDMIGQVMERLPNVAVTGTLKKGR